MPLNIRNKLKLNVDDQIYNTNQYLTSITKFKSSVQGNTLCDNQFSVSLKVMYSSQFL